MHGRIKTATQSRCIVQRHKWLSMQGRSDHKRPQVGAAKIIHYSLFIIHYSLFIIHYSLNKKSAPFQTTDLDIKFQCKIKVCRPPVTQLSPIGNNQNGEFTVAFSHTANLKRVTPARRNLKRHIAAVSGESPLTAPRCALLKMLSVGYTRLCKRHSR